MNCPDCNGTGWITLLTTREPCQTCAQLKVESVKTEQLTDTQWGVIVDYTMGVLRRPDSAKRPS